MDIFSIFAGFGGLLSLVIMALAAITPIMIYLIQRNTYQNRQELRKANKNLEQLIVLLKDQKISSTKEPLAEKPTSNTVTMSCPECGKTFKYGINHSGKYKPCPGCQKPILLK